MNVNQITSKVTYCGVNDRTTPLFENLWELPNGVCYNSYLVKGDNAIALIDASDSGHAIGFINHLNQLLDGAKVDYLVINHIEPDHSGAIPTLKEKYPDMKIVGNAKTADMLRGFYGIEDNVILVSENDTIDLGGCNLQFILTPMVHWPETMMTYLPKERMLFSGDAFGCFGALNGAIVDNQMDTDIYIREAYRYYACIVAKYGQFVLKAHEKISKFPIEYICPTHGPVWHGQIKEIGEIYHRMASWDADEGVVIAYGSMYGNTTIMAEKLASLLADGGIKSIRLHNVSHTPQSTILADIMRFRGLILIAPTYNSEIFPPIESLITAILERGMKNRLVGIGGSFSWGSQSVRKITNLFTEKHIEILTPQPQMKQADSDGANPDVEALAKNMITALKSMN